MDVSKYMLVAILGCPAVVDAQITPFPHRARAPQKCSVPFYDYQRSQTSLPNAAITFTAVLVEATPSEASPVVEAIAGDTTAATTETASRTKLATNTPRIRFFQLARPRIVVNHCVVSRVAVSLWDDGRCVINLRAEQSPPYLPEDILEPAALFKRNRFIVTARAYGYYRLSGSDEDGLSELGQPELLRIQQSFWVERGEALEKRIDGSLKQLQMPLDATSLPEPGSVDVRASRGISTQELFSRVTRMEVELRIE